MKKPVIIMAGTLFFCLIIPVFISVLFYRGYFLSSYLDKLKNSNSNIQKLESPYINVYDKKEDKVHKIQIEDFLYGVLSMEMSADFSEEALKSQAVAARTYIMYKIENNITSGHKGADICTDYNHCQAYSSYDELKTLKGEKWIKESYPIIKKAVDETRGQILTYDKEVILPLYFSTSSGVTENSGEVFMTQYPYLQSVSSPYEEQSPKYYTEKIIDKDSFIEKILKNCQSASLSSSMTISELQNKIKIISKTAAGSVKLIDIAGKNFTGLEIRRIFDLNSANFDLDFVEDKVVFGVRGYGHGVGMSQWGAQGLANNGFGYEDILKHYYTDTKIKTIY